MYKITQINGMQFLFFFQYNTWYPYAKVGPYRRGKVLPSGERQLHYTFEPAE